MLLLAIYFTFSLVSLRLPNGSVVRSDYPKDFTEKFKSEIIFIDQKPHLKQSGVELLESNQARFQILDETGKEILSFQKSDDMKSSYSDVELLDLYQKCAFFGALEENGKNYTYIIHFPFNLSKVTMYLNGDRFTQGKPFILLVIALVIGIVLFSGFLYGLWITRLINRLSLSIKEISSRSYLPINNRGTFSDVFEDLNQLDDDIRQSDKAKEETEHMRKDWIANITHDLKTPLSPIKGYAEILTEKDLADENKVKQYSQVILKNVCYMEGLIDDLKLTYQLDNGILPIEPVEQDFVRFLRELVIDVLNYPEYEKKKIHFDSEQEKIIFSFDQKLMTRAFKNLLINAFVHGNEDTEIFLKISLVDKELEISILDNGKGIRAEDLSHLFDRYYRGTNTEKKTAGTGLGLAITKSIVQAQSGRIEVASEPNIGTEFKIYFSL